MATRVQKQPEPTSGLGTNKCAEEDGSGLQTGGCVAGITGVWSSVGGWRVSAMGASQQG